jgi:hypothetical protein
MSYQAVIRNAGNQLVTIHTIGMRINILQGSSTGPAFFVETKTPNTNANGLLTVEIGGGTIITGTFAGITWTNGPYFIKTETDPVFAVWNKSTGINITASLFDYFNVSKESI